MERNAAAYPAWLTSLVVTIFSFLTQCFWLVQLNTRVDISCKILCRIIIKIFYEKPNCLNYKDFLPSLYRTFPFSLHGPLKTCLRTPKVSVDPGLRTPVIEGSL